MPTASPRSYKVPSGESAGSKYTLSENVHADAARAMRLVRSHAREWNVDPARSVSWVSRPEVEVAGKIETNSTPEIHAEDPIERVIRAPDFSVLVYPSYRPAQGVEDPRCSRSERCSAVS